MTRLVFLLAILGIGRTAMCDLFMHVDLDPATPGIQTSLPGSQIPGTIIPVDVVLSTNAGPVNVDFTSLDISFNSTPGVLVWGGAGTTAPASSTGIPIESLQASPTGVFDLFESPGPVTPLPAAPSGTTLAAGSTGTPKAGFTSVTPEHGVTNASANPPIPPPIPGAMVITSSAVVWSTTFTANAVGTTNLSADGGLALLNNGSADGRGFGAFSTFTGGYITATSVPSTLTVPEPSSALLLSVVFGLLSIALCARKST